MRRALTIFLAVSALMAITTATALGAITFHSGPTVTWNSDGSATATGNLSGLGNEPATATLQITQSYSYTCVNKGGNTAPGQNQVTTVGAPGTQDLSSTAKNGRSNLSVTAFPGSPAPTISGSAAGCPNGNWTGVNPVATGPATATLTITQGGQVIYQQTFTQP
jgi:hypothetical protein